MTDDVANSSQRPDGDRLTAALADRYRIERELGSGGMATVYLAQDVRHDRQVAVKVLHPHLAASLGAERFLREIRVTANLQHPHILPLFDSGTVDEHLYYVMPYVQGETLRARLNREHELPVDEGVQILRDIMDALTYAHARGIVHRDIKPENILFAGRHAVIADFGVAKAMRAASDSGALTGAGIALGTPAYMAPEQAMAEETVDYAADIYAFGVMAYEVFAGALPFSGATAQKVIAAHMMVQPPSLSSQRASVPAALEQLVMRCLEKRPADRWRTSEDVLHRLDALVEAPLGGPRSNSAASSPIDRVFPLSEAVCRKFNRATLDARVIGGELHYLDNQRESSVLVCYLHAIGLDQSQYDVMLRTSPYRALAPTLFGFEPGSRRRISLSHDDHITLVQEFLHDAIDRLSPHTVVLVGFSSGADFGFRLLSSEREPPRVDAFVALGCNINLETCFASRLIAQVTESDEPGIVQRLQSMGAGAKTLLDWLNLHEYFVTTFRKMRRDIAFLQRFASEVVQPFEAEGESPFLSWYRKATARVPQVRCVFEDAEPYNSATAAWRLRHLDEGIFGQHHRYSSLVTDPDTNHFDLIQPSRVAAHIEGALAGLREAQA